MSDVWLSTTEVARRLDLGVPTVRRFIDMGELQAYRMGRLIRVRGSDLEAFVDASRIEPGTLGA